MFGATPQYYSSSQVHSAVSTLTSPYADVALPGAPTPAPAPASSNHWLLWAVGGVVVGGGLYLLFK